MDRALTTAKFLAGYLPALGLVSAAPPPVPPLGQIFFVHVFGVPVPYVTVVIAILGIALSRPFAIKTEASLGWPLFAAVTLIMLIAVVLWIVGSRPGWLFAFVVSVGMGFSGYSLLELFGEEVKGFVRSIFARAKKLIPGTKGDGET